MNANVINNRQSSNVNGFYEKEDKKVSKIVSLQILLAGIKNMLMSSFPFFYSMRSFLNILLFVALSALYIYGFLLIRKRFTVFSKPGLLLSVFVLLSFGFSYFVFPNNVVYWSDWIVQTICYSFITVLFISKLNTLSFLSKYMVDYSYIIITISFVCFLNIFLIGHTTTSAWSTYSMSLSYVVLVAVMWLLFNYFSNNNKTSLVFAVVGTIIIVMCGSRNPLLAIFTYFIIKKIVLLRNGTAANYFSFFTMAIIGLIFVFNFSSIILMINTIFEKFGIYSRTLSLMLDVNSTTFLSNRDEIHRNVWSLINENPLLGLGIGGDMASMNEMAHGLFLSILITYGYLLGGFLIIILIVASLASLKTNNLVLRELVLLYMCLVFPRAFTGGDIWGSDVFWWLTGFLILSYKTKFNAMNKNIFIGDKDDKRIAHN